MKALQHILADVFNHRLIITPEQFVTNGFAERKLILVLEVYDLVKQIKRQSKVDKRIHKNVDKDWEHPCDIALKEYAVCDHQEKVRKEMEFRINPTLLSTKLEVKSVTKIEDKEKPTAVQESPNKDTKSLAASVHSHASSNSSSVFSVSSHFKSATKNAQQTTAGHKDQQKFGQSKRSETSRVKSTLHSEQKDLKETLEMRDTIHEQDLESETESAPIQQQASQPTNPA